MVEDSWPTQRAKKVYSILHASFFPVQVVLSVPTFLITQPFNNWKKSHEALSNHSLLKYHMQADCKMKAFIGTYTGVQKQIDHGMHPASRT